MEIGLHKSVISLNGLSLEFAKKTILAGVDVSPIPLKEYSAALETGSGLTSFVEKYALPDKVTKRLLGLGYKATLTSKRWVIFIIISMFAKGYKALEPFLAKLADHKTYDSVISSKKFESSYGLKSTPVKETPDATLLRLVAVLSLLSKKSLLLSKRIEQLINKLLIGWNKNLSLGNDNREWLAQYKLFIYKLLHSEKLQPTLEELWKFKRDIRKVSDALTMLDAEIQTFIAPEPKPQPFTIRSPTKDVNFLTVIFFVKRVQQVLNTSTMDLLKIEDKLSLLQVESLLNR
jgi:hypothetical protein